MCPDTDRDYTYEELLQRAFGQLRVRNPDMMGEKKKFIMKPPQVTFTFIFHVKLTFSLSYTMLLITRLYLG